MEQDSRIPLTKEKVKKDLGTKLKKSLIIIALVTLAVCIFFFWEIADSISDKSFHYDHSEILIIFTFVFLVLFCVMCGYVIPKIHRAYMIKKGEFFIVEDSIYKITNEKKIHSGRYGDTIEEYDELHFSEYGRHRSESFPTHYVEGQEFYLVLLDDPNLQILKIYPKDTYVLKE